MIKEIEISAMERQIEELYSQRKIFKGHINYVHERAGDRDFIEKEIEELEKYEFEIMAIDSLIEELNGDIKRIEDKILREDDWNERM